MRLKEQIRFSPSKIPETIRSIKLLGANVFLFGNGVYAYVVGRYLQARGIAVQGCVVDRQYWNSGFAKYKNITVEDFQQDYVNWPIVSGLADCQAAQSRVSQFSRGPFFCIDVPDFLNIPNDFFDQSYVEANITALQEAHLALSDELSHDTFVAFINAKFAGDPDILRSVVRRDHLYFPSTAEDQYRDQTLLDVGGFDGDSIRDFMQASGEGRREILSLEPFPDNFKRLCALAQTYASARILCLPLGAWDRETALQLQAEPGLIDSKVADTGTVQIDVAPIDTIVKRHGIFPDLIKMDINGAELRALRGAENTVRKQRPRLAIKIHTKEHLHQIPLFLKYLDPDVRLYLRLRNYMSMMLVLYAEFPGGRSFNLERESR